MFWNVPYPEDFQLKNYWDDGRKKLADELRDKLAFHRQQLNGDKGKNIELQKQIDSIKEQQRVKRRELHEMEMDPDLVYKDFDQASAKLALVEERYRQHQFSSIREEKQMVSEVDRLKRNVHRLGKYGPLVTRVNEMSGEIELLRAQLREVKMRMRKNVDGFHETKRRIAEELKVG